MKNNKSIIILVSILLVFIVLGAIALVVVNKEKQSHTPEGSNTNASEANTELVKDVKYIEIAIEDEESEEAEYKDIIKIEDKEKTKNLIKIINTGKEHEFNGAFGLDVLPYANLYLNNGDQIKVVAIDDLEMEGEENGNYIIFTKNEDEENKKIYKVEERVATELTRLYDEAEKNVLNSKKEKTNTTSKTDDDYFIIYNGFEMKKEVGVQSLSSNEYTEITEANKKRYNTTYYNYENGQSKGETKGTFGKEEYEGFSRVENVSKIAISKKYNAIPRKYSNISKVPEELKQDAKDYSSTSIQSIDLDGDGKKEYIVAYKLDVSKNESENGEPKASSKIVLYDSKYKKIADLVKLEDGFSSDVKEEEYKTFVEMKDVEYIDIDNDGVMEIIINIPVYEGLEVSVIKYSNQKVEGEVDYKASVLP